MNGGVSALERGQEIKERAAHDRVARDYLAGVLFLVGIGGHFPRVVRIGLVVLGVTLLLVAGVALLRLPAPA